MYMYNFVYYTWIYGSVYGCGAIKDLLEEVNEVEKTKK